MLSRPTPQPTVQTRCLQYSSIGTASPLSSLRAPTTFRQKRGRPQTDIPRCTHAYPRPPAASLEGFLLQLFSLEGAVNATSPKLLVRLAITRNTTLRSIPLPSILTRTPTSRLVQYLSWKWSRHGTAPCKLYSIRPCVNMLCLRKISRETPRSASERRVVSHTFHPTVPLPPLKLPRLLDQAVARARPTS